MLARDLDVISPGEYPHWERQAEGRSELSRWPGLAVVITYCYQPVCGAEQYNCNPVPVITIRVICGSGSVTPSATSTRLLSQPAARRSVRTIGRMSC